MSRAEIFKPSFPVWATDAFLECECQRVAAEVERFFETFDGNHDECHPDLADHVARIRDRQFKFTFDFLGNDAAFEVSEDDQILRFNLKVGLDICRDICADLMTPEHQRITIAKNAIALYILHEIRHVSQELEQYSSIQQLKSIEQNDLIAHFDLLADLSAAKDFASFRVWTERPFNHNDWNSLFVEALFVNVFYCIPIFDFPIESNWKMGRAIGLVLSLSRSTIIQQNLSQFKHASRKISIGLLVRPSSTYESASVLWIDKQLALAAVISEPANQWLQKIAHLISKGEMTEAFEIATSYIILEPAYWAQLEEK